MSLRGIGIPSKKRGSSLNRVVMVPAAQALHQAQSPARGVPISHFYAGTVRSTVPFAAATLGGTFREVFSAPTNANFGPHGSSQPVRCLEFGQIWFTMTAPPSSTVL